MSDRPWRLKTLQLKRAGHSWFHIMSEVREEWPHLFAGMSDEKAKATVRGWYRIDTGGYKKHQTDQEDSEASSPKGTPGADESWEKVHADGSREEYKILEFLRGKKYSPEEILEIHGFSPVEKWQLIDCKSNAWHGMTGAQRNNQLVELRQSTVRAKPKADTVTIADIDHYMETKRFRHNIPLPPPKQYDPSGETLEIDLPDFHGGLLAWIQETGADYDIHIAKALFFKCLYDIIARCKYRKFRQIIFATLGDLLHIDNDQQTTSKGTFQQSDGRMAKIADAVMDMLIDGIELLSNIAPVHVMFLSGNHDRVTGRMLMQSVHQAFRFRKGNTVTFDMSPNPQKYIEIGRNLIGFTHGCMAKQNMDKWLQVEAREAWGRCKHAEVHQGHNHYESVTEFPAKVKQTEDSGGVVVRTLPVICNASYWEHTEGYCGATKAMMCFVWHDDCGLREMWYSCA